MLVDTDPTQLSPPRIEVPVNGAVQPVPPTPVVAGSFGVPIQAPRRSPPPVPVTNWENLPPDLGDNVMRAISQEIQRIAKICEATPGPRAFFLITKLATMARDIKNFDAQPTNMSCDAYSSFTNNYLSNFPTGVPNTLAPAPPSETFGVTAIREVVAAAGRKKPEEIVAAIVGAKKAGLHDLARELRAQLDLPAEGLKKNRKSKRSTQNVRSRKRAA